MTLYIITETFAHHVFAGPIKAAGKWIPPRFVTKDKYIYINNVGFIDNRILYKVLNGSVKRYSEWVK